MTETNTTPNAGGFPPGRYGRRREPRRSPRWVRARAAHGSEIGREEVRVAPAPEVSRPRVVHRLATTERPVTGEVQRCWASELPAGLWRGW